MKRLNLGCGTQHKEGYINIDKRPEVKPDIVRDILRGLPFSDDSVDEVYSQDFLEHIPQAEVVWVMNEIWRVLKRGSVAQHIVALAGTANEHQDPTHLSSWNEETFTYFLAGHKHNTYYGSLIQSWDIVALAAGEKTITATLRKPC